MHLFRPKYTRDGEQKTSKTWWVEYYVEGRRFRESLKTRNRAAAQIKAAEIVKDVALGGAGVETHRATRQAEVDALVEDYCAELVRRKRDPIHVEAVRQQLGVMLEGVRSLEDVTPERVRQALERVESERGLSPTSVNRYRSALAALFRWLRREGRWSSNPVDAVAPLDTTGPDPEDTWRALTPAEVQRLAAAAPRRALLYLVAVGTGLRQRELKRLQWLDLDLEAGTLTVRSSKAKNKREAVQPLPAGLVELLVARRAKLDAQPADKVFRTTPRPSTFTADLEAAKIPKDGPEGKVVLSSLRKTYVTALAATGAPLSLTQRLARHSTPTLTSNAYTRFTRHDAREAVAKLDAHLLRGPLRGNPLHQTDSAALTAQPGGDTEESANDPEAALEAACERQDSNLHALRHKNLNHTRRSLEAAYQAGSSAGGGECLGGRLGGEQEPDPGVVARQLLRLAADAPDPRPLLDAAQALLAIEAERSRSAEVLPLRRPGSA